jgi:hypothetical protein
VPIYVFRCTKCEAEEERYRKLCDYHPPLVPYECVMNEGKPHEFVHVLTPVNFKIDPAAG